MKRRRKGGKKGKAKKPKIVKENEVTENADENPVVDQLDNDEVDSGAEAESPSPVAADVSESSFPLAEQPEIVKPARPSSNFC